MNFNRAARTGGALRFSGPSGPSSGAAGGVTKGATGAWPSLSGGPTTLEARQRELSRWEPLGVLHPPDMFFHDIYLQKSPPGGDFGRIEIRPNYLGADT